VGVPTCLIVDVHGAPRLLDQTALEQEMTGFDVS
jgi:hypothetical protein